MGFGGDQGYIFGFDYGTFTPKNLLLQNPGGNVGIGTLSPTAGKLHVDGGSNTAVYATSTNGIGTYAVSGTNAAVYGYSTDDYGVDGRSFSSIGVYGQSYSSGGMWGQGPYIGVQGNSTGTDVNRQAIRGVSVHRRSHPRGLRPRIGHLDHGNAQPVQFRSPRGIGQHCHRATRHGQRRKPGTVGARARQGGVQVTRHQPTRIETDAGGHDQGRTGDDVTQRDTGGRHRARQRGQHGHGGTLGPDQG